MSTQQVGGSSGESVEDRHPELWPDEVYRVLRANGVTQFGYVPDAGHRVLIERCIDDPQAHAVSLTTEEEGIGLVAGADLGGARAVLLIQSSGVGNCINLLSLISNGGFPFLALVSMRGDFGEGNPWQYAMGQATPAVLEAMGVVVYRAERKDEVVTTVQAGLTTAYKGGRPAAVLLTQKLLGAKAF